jgi:hypothetical protein
VRADPLIYVVISHHGFGHIAQTAPVIAALRARIGGLRVIVQCAAPRAVLEEHFHMAFEHIAEASDFGMVMANSLDVDVAGSHARYLSWHADWDNRLGEYAARLRRLKPRLVLSNVAYLPLAAAREAGIPAAGYCSLNWADIYQPYCRDLPGAASVHRQMLDAYRAADVFLIPTPGMPMPDLGNRVTVGPVARVGHCRREAIAGQLGLFMGGVHTRLPIAQWPPLPGVQLLTFGTDVVDRPRIATVQSLALPYIDVLRSCDALVTKPGYGSFAEAACNAVPVLYTHRHGWPEAAYLVEWLAARGRCAEIRRADLEAGRLGDALRKLWDVPPPAPVAATGAEETATYLCRWF